MRGYRKIVIIVVLILVGLLVSGCQESNESKYNRAQKLLSEAKYDEAIKVFEEISTYEDASKMTMYAKALSVAESGDYQTAIANFNALGDFKDCPMMITYYTARQYESQASADNWSSWNSAAETYNTISLFLDSKERAENCLKSVYDEAVRLADAGQYSQGIELLESIKDYSDAAKLKEYYSAFILEQNDEFVQASEAFSALGDYRDSKDQAEAVLSRGYEKAESVVKAGDLANARVLFLSLNGYKDSYERANKPYYDLGIAKREEGKWDESVAAFERVQGYSDSADQIKETKYQEASAMEAGGDQEGAFQLFRSLSGYKDSFDRAYKPYYDLGIAMQEEGKWDESVAAFKRAITYSDAATQIKATRYAEGLSKQKAQDWDGARTAFEKAGEYKDAVTQIKETQYLHALELQSAGKLDEAFTLLIDLGDYKDSSEKAYKAYYDSGIAQREGKQWVEAISSFTKAGDYSDAKAQIIETKYQQALSLCESGDYKESYALLKEISSEKDVSEVINTNENLSSIEVHEKVTAPFKKPGNYVLFGRYTQNAAGDNPEPIEWLVLTVEDEKALLLSKYILEASEFSLRAKPKSKYSDSIVRSWLTGEFYRTAFSTEEQAVIIKGKQSTWTGEIMGGEEETEDKVFLLTKDELRKYFGGEGERLMAVPTSHARSQDLYMGKNNNNMIDGKTTTSYWTRSALNYNGCAIFIDETGSMECLKKEIKRGVRPAIWIDLNNSNLDAYKLNTDLNNNADFDNNQDESKTSEEINEVASIRKEMDEVVEKARNYLQYLESTSRGLTSEYSKIEEDIMVLELLYESGVDPSDIKSVIEELKKMIEVEE